MEDETKIIDADLAALGAVHADSENFNVLYRHKRIRRFRIGDFEFKDYQLRINDSTKNDEFVALLGKIPPIDSIDIVIVNEAAAAAAERPAIGAQGIRGAMQASDILTAKDREALAAHNAAKSGPAGNSGAKPGQGLNIAGLLNK